MQKFITKHSGIQHNIVDMPRRFIIGHVDVWHNDPDDYLRVSVWPMKEQALADAQMIKAAPLLLSALIKAVEEYDSIGCLENQDTTYRPPGTTKPKPLLLQLG